MTIDPKSPITVVCLTVITFENFLGILSNLFIALVLLHGRYKERNIHYGNRIRITVNRSSIVFSSVLTVTLFFKVFWPKNVITLSILFTILPVYTWGAISCHTAILCFYQFIKIIQFQTGILGWVKAKINTIVPWLLIAADVLSLCFSFLAFLPSMLSKEYSTNSSNFSSTDQLQRTSGISGAQYLLSAILFLSYLSVLVTTILAIRSLKLQSLKMKDINLSGDVSKKTYKSTVFKMTRFLIFYTFFYSVLFLGYFISSNDYQNIGFWTEQIILFFYSPANSLLLILSNPKLRSICKMTLCCFGIFQCQTRERPK